MGDVNTRLKLSKLPNVHSTIWNHFENEELRKVDFRLYFSINQCDIERGAVYIDQFKAHQRRFFQMLPIEEHQKGFLQRGFVVYLLSIEKIDPIFKKCIYLNYISRNSF